MCNAHAGRGRPPAALRRRPSLHGTISHSDSLDLLSLATGIQGNSIAVTGSNTVLQPVGVGGSVLSHRRTSSAPDVHTTAAAAVLNTSEGPAQRRSMQQHARRHRRSLDATEQQQQQLELQANSVSALAPRHSVTVKNETAEAVTAVEAVALPPVPDRVSSASDRRTMLEAAVDNSKSRGSDASTLQIGVHSSSSNSSSSTANTIATSPVKLMHSGKLRQGRLRLVAPTSSTATASTLLPAIDTANTTGAATVEDGAVEQRCNRASTK
jgi:hypothetical protein